MKTKIYLDCSIFGGYYDVEFQKETRLLFEKIENGEFLVYVSDTLETELNSAPIQIQELMIKFQMIAL